MLIISFPLVHIIMRTRTGITQSWAWKKTENLLILQSQKRFLYATGRE